MKTIEGMTALVTGASSGIGRAIAVELARCGVHLVLVSNEEQALLTLRQEIEHDYGVALTVFCMDLSTDTAAQSLYQRCVQKKLGVDILVNNAGIFFFGEAVDADAGNITTMLRLHVMTPSLLCTLFGRGMKERRRGFILNVGSIVAYKDFPGIAYYGATKRYIRAFSESLRSEMQEYGVGVTLLCPGAVATGLYNVPVRSKLLYLSGILANPEAIARIGVRALFKHKTVVVPGMFYKIVLPFVRLIPRFVIDLIKNRTDLVVKRQRDSRNAQ